MGDLGRVDALVSYHYYGDTDVMEQLTRVGRLRLIGDSGAYSAHASGAVIDLPSYAGWLNRWGRDLAWAASLDVIGDPVASMRNWLTLRDFGLTTVPTVHAGADLSTLDAYAAEGATLVGLGGMAGNGPARRAWRWTVAMFRYARDHHPQVRFHLWGVTHRRYLDQLPAYSADSSGLLTQAIRFGELRLFDPATGGDRNVELDGREVFAHGSFIRRVYGVDPAEIQRSHGGNWQTLVQVAASSAQQYAGWLQQRHRVTPPALLADRSPGPGTRVHVVATDPAYLLAAVGIDVPTTKRGTK
jgi:hypothetical protein